MFSIIMPYIVIFLSRLIHGGETYARNLSCITNNSELMHGERMGWLIYGEAYSRMLRYTKSKDIV